ncbi:MAG: glycosyltransferase family 4 protein, partial [Candidatus Hydrothermarchaeales archaeon]
NEKKKFDIIVAHDWLDLPSGMAAKEATGLPLVYHVHATEIGRSLGSPTWELVNLELTGGREADLVITVSHAMKDEMIKTGFPGEKIRVCHNGVDTDIFSPGRVKKERTEELRKEFDIKDDEAVLLYVGRLEQMKGVDNLVSAMPLVLKENPDTKLLILGKGTLEGKIKHINSDLGIEDKVVMDTRFVDDEAKIHYYAATDCCIFPSLYEPFGIVALEAMAMERPVVVGAHGTSGLRESVVVPPSEGATGIHVDPNRPDDIAWGTNAVLEDRERAKTWGKNGRKRVLEYFTWDKVVEETIKVYREVIL